MNMKTMNPYRPSRGFSLIEVLVAVVVLSIGLLALASLQLSLIRASGETKTQSAAIALAKEKIETLASYQDVGGTDNTCISPSNGTANTCYRAITSETATSPSTNTVTVGGVTYRRSTTVTRYVYNKSSVDYGAVGNTLLDSGVKALSANNMPGKEFKRVDVTVAWTDSTGNAQRVLVEDAIAGIAPGDTISLTGNKGNGSPRKAVVIITNPASVPGVIPIAVGNGSDTAATNPRPILLSQGQNNTLLETRFDIYTYAALNGAQATAQSRVETSVIGCKCTTGGGTATAFRPTYWDGSKYVAPDSATGIPASVPKNNVDQSTLCTACCRDHQDPTGGTTGTALVVASEKFDPRRSTHYHYLNSVVTAAEAAGTTAASVDMTAAGSDYDEACRLIRVDGVFRVAAEPYDDYYGLLPTNSLNSGLSSTQPAPPAAPVVVSADTVPTSTATTGYQAFVKNYLQARFVDRTVSDGTNPVEYNVPLDPYTVTGASALDTLASAGIGTTSRNQYLHSRGLIVDYLPLPVRKLVYDATHPASNCPDTSGDGTLQDTEKQACVFKLLPFTSINLTELAEWKSTVPGSVEVTNNDFKTTVNSPFPVKGQAVLKTNAASGTALDARSKIQRASAGLAIAPKVYPDADLPKIGTVGTEYIHSIMQDYNNQHYVTGTLPTPPPSGGTFYTLLTGTQMLAGVDYSSAPKIVFSLSNNSCNKDDLNGDGVTATDMDGNTSNDDSTKPDESRCAPDFGNALGGSVTVDVTNYNRTATVDVGNACTNTVDTKAMPYRKDYDVTSASQVSPGYDIDSDGLYTSPGDIAPFTLALGAGSPNNVDSPGDSPTGEYTRFVINPLLNGDHVTMNFGPATYLCPDNWSTYITNAGAELDFTNSQRNDNALCGTGGTHAPQWSTNYGSCPTGFAPFGP
jgi:type IV pilus modification protein PilV